ncbi:hypothetical protein M501DRAFT_942 [Patellaria atrata CBS 101060]|uniref:Uncharacterized protein n=1 Tax=Patellaria atrata CBS 101060 TaxID=1346257 RepID=A0A9P4VT09_9PEZI|nr:hypothetical protein M501DRAFT_942 [Patellaria atrata CBS 101060]
MNKRNVLDAVTEFSVHLFCVSSLVAVILLLVRPNFSLEQHFASQMLFSGLGSMLHLRKGVYSCKLPSALIITLVTKRNNISLELTI